MLRRLRGAGFKTETFGYSSALHSFDSIVARLTRRLLALAEAGDYVVIGHSLGGVLLRAALTSWPDAFAHPQHVFLLGSPQQASRLAISLRRNSLFKLFAGDCGQLLGSPSRIGAIGALSIPTTGIAGVRGLRGRLGPFGDEANDGVVAVSEVVAPWLSNQIEVPVVHTLLPSSALVTSIVLRGLRTLSTR